LPLLSWMIVSSFSGEIMTRRRMLLIALGLLVILLVVFFCWDYPALSITERQLIGQWMAPEPYPRAGFITSKGPLTNPWRVWELRRDRSFCVWIVSADDPGVSILFKEGRWSAGQGTITLEGFEASGEALREIREHIRVKFGGSYVGRTSGKVSHPIRFINSDTWEVTAPQGKPITWNRRH
jgi:hypothetical protein